MIIRKYIYKFHCTTTNFSKHDVCSSLLIYPECKLNKLTSASVCFYLQSIRIYDAKDCQINSDPEPLQILNDCHQDWITGCQWSNIADILVSVYI